MSGCHLPFQSQDKCNCVFCLAMRVDKLETLIDVKKMEQIILDGANLHATILKFEARMKEIERFQDITHLQYQNNINKSKPHKCPVCDGTGKDKNKLVAEPYDEAIKILVAPPCHACEGKGIVWG